LSLCKLFSEIVEPLLVQLAVFDLLTKPDMHLTKDETKQVKAIARQLLATLKEERLVLDWQQRQQTRAGVKLAIKQMLDELPQKFTTEVYDQKCNMVYQYVYDIETTAA
jgi:type I restriction enzyme R subunit